MSFFLNLDQVSKLVLDEYFTSNEFLSGVEAAEFGLTASSNSSIPLSHTLNSTSPFVDSGIGLNVLAQGFSNQTSVDVDEVFVIEDDGKQCNRLKMIKLQSDNLYDFFPSILDSKATNIQPNGLTRSRRSHFSHGESSNDTSKDAAKYQPETRISYEKDRLLHFSKSIFSWEVPREWVKICELYPNIVRNKVRDSDNNNRYCSTNNNNNNNDNKIQMKSKEAANKGMLRRSATISY